MAWNPKTQNLLQSTDISDALDRAVEYLDTSESDEPRVEIPSDNTFALRMRMHRFIKSFKIQMKDNESVDENKYNHLKIIEKGGDVVITSSLEQQPLVLKTDEGKEL